MKYRLFIAIPIPDEIKNKIIDSIKLPDNFRITGFQNLHITLLFLGETEESKIIEITKILNKSIKYYKSFNLEISKYDQFPASGYPKIIFLTGENGKNELFNIANDIRSEFKKIGFYDNKSFKYHITVARQKYKNDEQFFLPELNNSLEFKIDKIILYKSDLRPNGPVYTPIWTGELNI